MAEDRLADTIGQAIASYAHGLQHVGAAAAVRSLVAAVLAEEESHWAHGDPLVVARVVQAFGNVRAALGVDQGPDLRPLGPVPMGTLGEVAGAEKAAAAYKRARPDFGWLGFLASRRLK